MRNFKHAVPLRATPRLRLSHILLVLIVMSCIISPAIAGDYDRDVAGQREIVAKDPENLDQQYELAKLLSWNGNHDEAVQVFEGIIRRDPDYRDAEIGLARVLAWSGKQEKAIEKFEELAKKYPTHFESFQGLGSLYLWGNNFEKAITYFKKALELRPNDILSMKGIGRAYLGRGDQARADYFFTRAQIMELRGSPARLVLYGVILLVLIGGIVWLTRRWSTKQKTRLLQMELKILRYVLALLHQRSGKFPLALEGLLTEKWIPPGNSEQRPLLEGVRQGERGVIVDPFGNRYFYNPDHGTVHSSTPGCEEW